MREEREQCGPSGCECEDLHFCRRRNLAKGLVSASILPYFSSTFVEKHAATDNLPPDI